MKKVNWNELRDKVHENAISKGFWNGQDEDYSLPKKLALIHFEVSEALEADRKDRHAGDLDAENGMLIEEMGWNEWFESYIKDTFEDELADVVIRCLDLCGKLKIDIDRWMKEEYSDVKDELLDLGLSSISEKLFMIHGCITFSMIGETIAKSGIQMIITSTIFISEQLNIDLLTHINLKMRYNSTREYKHGKRY